MKKQTFMKLRIRGNTIRLRLSKGEVQKFKEIGHIKDQIQFGIEAGQQLTYTLVKADVPKLQCELKDNTIQVFVPTELAYAWVNTELVGMEHLVSIDEKNQLRILIEKDFKCLHVRINEDEKDAFPHPKA